LATAALEDGDHTSCQFLQPFFDEQVEEERTARRSAPPRPSST